MSASEKAYDEALSFFRDRKIDEAIQKLEALLQNDSTFEDAYEALALLYQRQNRLDEAIEMAKRWIRLNPQAIMAHTNLSRFYVAKGMIAEAEHEQGEARKLSWIQELKQKKMQMPKVDPKAKIERFKKVTELDPRDVLGYYSLGDAYLEVKMYREATEAFIKGIEVDPQHSSSYLGLGQAHEALGEKGKAIDTYRKGIRVADERGDVMPMKKMQARLDQLSSERS